MHINRISVSGFTRKKSFSNHTALKKSSSADAKDGLACACKRVALGCRRSFEVVVFSDALLVFLLAN